MKQLNLFSAAVPSSRHPEEFLADGVKRELMTLMTRVIIATYINEKNGGRNEQGDFRQDHGRASQP